jgi:16S rRNA (uracil1498-N3)-methyltransferase
MSPRIQIFANTSGLSTEDELSIPENNRRHLLQVLRLKDGASVTVVCERTRRVCECEISSKESTLRIISANAAEDEPTAVKSVAFALCKGKKNDLVCEKLTELGAENIIFWGADRSVSRLKSEKDEKQKLDRWQRIAETASMQSGRTALPSIHFCATSTDLISLYNDLAHSDSLKLVFTISEGAEPMRNFAPPASGAHLLIGPEGDFSDRELADFTNNGFSPATLGKNILRAETAALTAAAIAQGLWGFRE